VSKRVSLAIIACGLFSIGANLLAIHWNREAARLNRETIARLGARQ
jgi:hypothetical protein